MVMAGDPDHNAARAPEPVERATLRLTTTPPSDTAMPFGVGFVKRGADVRARRSVPGLGHLRLAVLATATTREELV